MLFSLWSKVRDQIRVPSLTTPSKLIGPSTNIKTSKKIQDATKRLAALNDKIKIRLANREEYQQRVIKAVRGPLEEAIEALQKPSTGDVDYMINPGNNTADTTANEDTAVISDDDEDIAIADDLGAEDLVYDADTDAKGDGDILVDGELLYVREYLGDQWTQTIVRCCGSVCLNLAYTNLQIYRRRWKQSRL